MLSSITRDNASNNTSFIEEFSRRNPGFQYDIRCTAHILNIIAGDLLKGFLSTAEIDQDILRYINRRLIVLNNEEDEDDEEDEEEYTPEFNSKYLIIIYLSVSINLNN